MRTAARHELVAQADRGLTQPGNLIARWAGARTKPDERPAFGDPIGRPPRPFIFELNGRVWVGTPSPDTQRVMRSPAESVD